MTNAAVQSAAASFSPASAPESLVALGAAFMGELNQLAAKTGAAFVLIHHFAKSASTKIANLI